MIVSNNNIAFITEDYNQNSIEIATKRGSKFNQDSVGITVAMSLKKTVDKI